jgi:hypothetical protein
MLPVCSPEEVMPPQALANACVGINPFSHPFFVLQQPHHAIIYMLNCSFHLFVYLSIHSTYHPSSYNQFIHIHPSPYLSIVSFTHLSTQLPISLPLWAPSSHLFIQFHCQVERRPLWISPCRNLLCRSVHLCSASCIFLSAQATAPSLPG